MRSFFLGMMRSRTCGAFVLLLSAVLLAGCSSHSTAPTGGGGGGGQNPVPLTQISSDSFTVPPGQHATEVEPHVFANGNTLVAAFQTGRIAPGGSTDIGWATSTDGGNTWSHGSLPGITTGEGSGPYSAVSDPNVAYDAKHGLWLISSLPILGTPTPAVLVSSSSDGMTWQNPVGIGPMSNFSDKNWIVCDNTSSSPHYGNCYVEYDDAFSNDLIMMSTSSDGGQTWTSVVPTANLDDGIGGQPLVQPNGNVVVPIESFGGQAGFISAFLSSDGGANWSGLQQITPIQLHADAGGIRSGPLPSAAIDGAGTVWIVWEDCRFRSGCASNDLVYVTSSDGVTWSSVSRVAIDQTSSTADYFIPGIGIDPATSGTSAHVAIHYYYYSQTNCTVSTCQLYVGYVSSANGGSTWNTPTTLTAPMQLSWLPNSDNGLMVGDYIATAFVAGVPHGVFAVAAANSGSTFNEAMFTAPGLTVSATGRQLSAAKDRPLHNLSDKIEREKPEKGVPPLRHRARRRAK